MLRIDDADPTVDGDGGNLLGARDVQVQPRQLAIAVHDHQGVGVGVDAGVVIRHADGQLACARKVAICVAVGQIAPVDVGVVHGLPGPVLLPVGVGKATTRNDVPGVGVGLVSKARGPRRGIEECELGGAVKPAVVLADPFAIRHVVGSQVVGHARALQDRVGSQADVLEGADDLALLCRRVGEEHVGDVIVPLHVPGGEVHVLQARVVVEEVGEVGARAHDPGGGGGVVRRRGTDGLGVLEGGVLGEHVGIVRDLAGIPGGQAVQGRDTGAVEHVVHVHRLGRVDGPAAQVGQVGQTHHLVEHVGEGGGGGHVPAGQGGDAVRVQFAVVVEGAREGRRM